MYAIRSYYDDDPGFDLWADTTTLFTRLHKGTDATGPVIGSGVLTLGVDDSYNFVECMLYEVSTLPLGERDRERGKKTSSGGFVEAAPWTTRITSYNVCYTKLLRFRLFVVILGVVVTLVAHAGFQTWQILRR